VMSGGHVVDDGSPEELRERPGLYRDLLNRQFNKGHGTPPTPDSSDETTMAGII